jgi:site-specific recombinase XerD
MTQMFDSFLKHLDEKGLDPKTIANYKASWSKFSKWLLQVDPDLKDPGSAIQRDIANYKRHMQEAGGRNGKPATESTMQLAFVHLNAIFRYFHEQGRIPTNPVEPIRKPRAARRKPKWHSRNEQNAILREVRRSKSKRDNAIFTVFLHVGLRVHELCDLLRDELVMNPRSGSVYVRGKGFRDREVPLNVDARYALESYLADRKDDSPYVFTSERSPKMSVRGVQHIVEKYRKRTGIKNLSCHSLRHTFGHELLTATGDPQKVAMLMGHFKENGDPNIAMTMIYTTPSVEDLEAAVESISWT